MLIASLASRALTLRSYSSSVNPKTPRNAAASWRSCSSVGRPVFGRPAVTADSNLCMASVFTAQPRDHSLGGLLMVGEEIDLEQAAIQQPDARLRYAGDCVDEPRCEV